MVRSKSIRKGIKSYVQKFVSSWRLNQFTALVKNFKLSL